jgi:hypothetical protein
MDELIKDTESKWKEVMDNYLGLMEALISFQATAPDVPPDQFGPEVQLVYARGLHKQKPVYVVEHLEWEHTQKGDLLHLIPRQPEPVEPVKLVEEPDEEQEQPSVEAPLEPEGGTMKGIAPDSSKKESTAKKAG